LELKGGKRIMFDQIGIGIIQALIVVSVVFIVLLLPIGDYLLRKK
jgi:hypothetical protein